MIAFKMKDIWLTIYIPLYTYLYKYRELYNNNKYLLFLNSDSKFGI